MEIKVPVYLRRMEKSEFNSSFEQIDFSTDPQIITEASNEQLLEENANLTKQNSVLKAQFDQAVKITEKMNETHIENEKLKAMIRNLNNEKQDLTQRLEILGISQKELTDKYEKEKSLAGEQIESDKKTTENEIEKIKSFFSEKNEKITKQLTEQQELNKLMEVSHKTILGKIENILKNCSKYFNQEFASFDDFCLFIEHQSSCGYTIQTVQPNDVPLYPVQQVQNNDERLQSCARKIKALKKQLKESERRSNELKATIANEKDNFRNTETFHQKEINELNQKINTMKEDFSLKEDKLKHQISLLEARISAAKSETKKVQKQQQQQVVQTPTQPIVIQQVTPEKKQEKKIEEFEEINEQYQSRIKELTKQLDIQSKKYSEVCSSNKEIMQKMKEMKEESEKSKNELSALKSVHQETVSEVTALRSALHSKCDSQNKTLEQQRKREYQKMKALVTNLDKKVESLKNQLFEAESEKEKIQLQYNEQCTKLSVLTHEAEEAKQSEEKMKKELNETKLKLSSKKEITEEDIFPSASWTNNSFDTEINKTITTIATNRSLSCQSKLQHIYKTILSYYDQKNQVYEAKINASYEQTAAIKAKIDDFIVSLTIALSDSPVTLEQFLADGLGQQILSTAKGLRTKANDEQRRAECLQAIFDSLASKLGANSVEDVITKIEMIMNETTRMKEIISNKKKSQKILKSNINELQKKLNSHEMETNTRTSQLENEIKVLNNSSENLKKSIQKLKEELKEARERICELEAENAELLSEKEEREESFNSEIEKITQETEQKHIQVELHLQNQIRQAEESMKESENQIAKFKKAICMQKKTISEKEQQLQQQKEEAEKSLNAQQQRGTIEKEQLIKNYEKAIEEITEQCNAHRNDVEKLSKELSKAERRSKEAKSFVIKTKLENTKLKKEIKTHEEQFEREKKLHESSLKNSMISAETTFNSKINAMKAKYEEEKRSLIAFAASEFAQFFTSTESVDEKSFKTLITRVKDHLSSLAKSDSSIRRMLNVQQNQSTDDAVAQLILV